MKLTIPALLCLVTELVSVDARVLSASIGRRDGIDLEDNLLYHLMARDAFDYEQVAGLLARGNGGRKPSTSASAATTKKTAPKPAAIPQSINKATKAPTPGNKASGITKSNADKSCVVKRADGRLYRRMVCEDGTGQPGSQPHNPLAQQQALPVNPQQAHNEAQQANNHAQQQHNTQQHGHNTDQQTSNQQQHVGNTQQNTHNAAQNEHNTAQKAGNEKQQASNTKQQKKNKDQLRANADQLADNLLQKGHNEDQHKSNTAQEVKNQAQLVQNHLQETLNTNQATHNLAQERQNEAQTGLNKAQTSHNDAQKTANTRQQQENDKLRHEIEKAKPTKIDKCIDFISGACTVGAGAVAATGAYRMNKNPDDPEAFGLAMGGAGATMAAGLLSMAKEPIKKCVNGICSWVAGKYNGNPAQHAGPNNIAPPSEIIVQRSLVRRGILTDMLIKKGLPEHEIAAHVRRDSQRYLTRNLVRRSVAFTKRADVLDDFIWD